MTLAELLALVSRSPETLLLVLAFAQAVSFALGLVGSAIEELGAKAQWPAVEAFGQRIEAFFSDLPKLWRGSRAPLRAASAKDSPAAVADNPPSVRGVPFDP